MPMMSAENEALRVKGWRVFRSSSRDRVIPGTGAGAHLQRIKISEALPVEGVFEGVAQPVEARNVAADLRAQAEAKARAAAAEIPLGVTRHIVYDLTTQVGNPDPVNFGEETFVIGIAPFDGFLTEMFLQLQGGAVVQGIAFRTTTGQTVFSTRDFSAIVPGFGGAEPDFLMPFDLNVTPAPFQLNRLKVPVYAGEEVFAVVRLGPAFPAGSQIGAGVIGFEGFILARPGSAAAQAQFGSLSAAARQAATEATKWAGMLALEREKTTRATEVERLKTERAAIVSQPRQASGGFIGNPYETPRITDAMTNAVQRQAPTPPPPPRVVRPPATPPEGTGLTFVSAWNPSFGSIGYLIPDPPRGGKVNVFDSKYTIWDITGKNIGEGQIIPVATDQDIPPGAKISAIRSGVKSQALRADTLEAFT